MAIELAKLSGSGNDFICIDARDGRHDAMLADRARIGHFAHTLCSRSVGVGADGVIFALSAQVGTLADIAARFFEPDGSEAELCGNGAACFARWAADATPDPAAKLVISTPAGAVEGQRRDGNYVRACLPLPRQIRRNLDIEAAGRHWLCDFAVTGVPHAVTYVDSAEALDVATCGAAIRNHRQFAPRGANANFVQVLGEGEIAVRTFEFGVEGETLACGTGSATAALLAAVRFAWPKAYTCGERPVLVHSRGGDIIRVYFAIRGVAGEGAAAGPAAPCEHGIAVTDLCLETTVRYIFRGVLHAEMEARATAPAADAAASAAGRP